MANQIVRVGGEALRAVASRFGVGAVRRHLPRRHDAPLPALAAAYDVVIMKHCYPASDIVEDTGKPDPSSERKSLENYKAIYRLLRSQFARYPDTLFIIWTLPPLHRLVTAPEKGARATEFSEWLKTEFLAENGPHRNIRVWDFRSLVMDPSTGCLKREYELGHERPDSHPNSVANNVAGPCFAQFLVDSIVSFRGGVPEGVSERIVFLHHSTGANVYHYPDLGVRRWFDEYNRAHGTAFSISDLWYPAGGNMPVDYYRVWLANRGRGDGVAA